MTDNNCCKCTTPQYTLTLNAQGPQGITGKNGQDGISPTINVNTNNASTYILEISDINGTFTTPNLKGGLPNGGTSGQLLTKYGNNDGEYNWQDLNLPNTLLYKDKYQQYVNGSITFLNNGDLTSISGLAVMNTTSGDGVGLAFTPNNIVLVDTQNGVTIGTTGYFYNTKNLVAGNNVTITQNQEAGTWSINATAEPYTLPVATTTTLGGVKPDGKTITVDNDGTIHGASTYTLPQATNTTLGGIKAEAKIDTDTQPVRIDTATGLLYTAAGGGTDLENVQDVTNGIVIGDLSTPIPSTGDYYKNTIQLTAEPNSGYWADFNLTINSTIYTNGILTGNSSRKILTEYNGIVFVKLTEQEYTDLANKNSTTMYILTDTNDVYLGTIKLTGGGASGLTPVVAAGLGLGTEDTGYVGATTITVTNPDEEVV